MKDIEGGKGQGQEQGRETEMWVKEGAGEENKRHDCRVRMESAQSDSHVRLCLCQACFPNSSGKYCWPWQCLLSAAATVMATTTALSLSGQ